MPDPGNISTSKSKDSSESFLKLIPQGLEKGKGSELADKAKIWDMRMSGMGGMMMAALCMM